MFQKETEIFGFFKQNNLRRPFRIEKLMFYLKLKFTVSEDKKSSLTGKNASFVNTSFQPEDHDDPTDL